MSTHPDRPPHTGPRRQKVIEPISDGGPKEPNHRHSTPTSDRSGEIRASRDAESAAAAMRRFDPKTNRQKGLDSFNSAGSVARWETF